MKALIKKGARIWQDHKIKEWIAEEPIVFDAEDFNETHCVCKAHGFGIISSDPLAYGNGAVYAKKTDLVEVGDQVELFKRFKLVAHAVEELSRIVQNPGARVSDAELTEWTTAMEDAMEDLGELALDVIRFVKGGPAS